jgi:uncharacterized protein YjeT (DUF2065 family)
MSDLVVGLGLVLVIEGLMWALVPQKAKQALEAASMMGETRLRSAGAIAVALGVLLVWLVRG